MTNDTITITRAEFVAYQAAVELANREDRYLAREYAKIEAERMAAEADNAALVQALLDWIAADGTNRFTDRDEDLAELARSLRTTPHPGAQLLTELAAARAVVAAAQDVLDNAAPVEDESHHVVPDMQIARLDRAMHEATKARAE